MNRKEYKKLTGETTRSIQRTKIRDCVICGKQTSTEYLLEKGWLCEKCYVNNYLKK